MPDIDGKDRHCPVGTIPIRRVGLDEMKRFSSLKAFLQKSPDGGSGLAPEKPPGQAGHEYAVSPNDSTGNTGIESIINLWSPAVETWGDFSLSQVWVVGDATAQGPLQTVEAGLQVYPQKYGNYGSNLFIYFTPDNYGSGGCYNQDCGAFVQTSSAYSLGVGWSAYSSWGGPQYEVKFTVRPNIYGDWWVGINGTWIGYWPSNRFYPGGLTGGNATRIQAGGEITNSWPGGHHITSAPHVI